jgi:hypothetical protein
MRLLHGLALIGIVAVLPLVNPGCSKYGEGSPCSTDNTDPITHVSDDCEDGLVCTPSNMLQTCSDSAICCPPAGQTATSPACILGNGSANCGNGGNGGDTSGSNTGGSGGGTGGSGGSTGTGGHIDCPHDECEKGLALIAGEQQNLGQGGADMLPICSFCVNTICAEGVHPECCMHGWDGYCVGFVKSVCLLDTCGGGTGGAGGSGGMSSGGGGTGGT